MSRDDKVLLDRLAKTLAGVSPERLDQILRKSENVQIRVTPAEKDGMKRMAKDYRLSVTEYLTRLHLMVEEIRHETRTRKGRRTT